MDIEKLQRKLFSKVGGPENWKKGFRGCYTITLGGEEGFQIVVKNERCEFFREWNNLNKFEGFPVTFLIQQED